MNCKKSKAEAKSPSYSPTESDKNRLAEETEDDNDHKHQSDQENKEGEDSPTSEPSVRSISPPTRRFTRTPRPYMRRPHMILRAIYDTRNTQYIDAIYDTRTWTVVGRRLRLVNIDAYNYLRSLLLRAMNDARSLNLNHTDLHWLQDLRSDEHY